MRKIQERLNIFLIQFRKLQNIISMPIPPHNISISHPSLPNTANQQIEQHIHNSQLLLTPQKRNQTSKKQILDSRLSKTDEGKKNIFLDFPLFQSSQKTFSLKTTLLSSYVDKEIKYTGCNCRKSQCLKMYCTCFTEGKMCDETCLCDSCKNDHDNMDRSEAINEIIEKDPFAFSKKTHQPNISFDDDFCNCKKSNCTKKYCDCYRRGKVCGAKCNCADCNNSLAQQKHSEEQETKKKIKKQ